MPDRTVIQWDKDDLDALGLLKVDVLALGMLSAIRRAFDLINGFGGSKAIPGELSLAAIPPEDATVYDMICRADTVGVFQIESRAQMAMLPRLRPRCYYDLVIEVAIVRPGPIQGEMVHPYLRRRCGEEAVSYPSKDVEVVLKRTLGVPIFQEQVMQLAIVAAGFSPGEADGLRRATAAWKRKGGLEPFQRQLEGGMKARGYPDSFAEQIFKQILGFGEYGFPESHAASFALLVYISAWLKHHEPAAFCAALINSQPMGFYAPAQLVRDARAHGVQVRSVAVAVSAWDCTLERCEEGRPALRLGLRMVKHLSQAGALRSLAARQARPFTTVDDLAERAGSTGVIQRRWPLPTRLRSRRSPAPRGLAGERRRARSAAVIRRERRPGRSAAAACAARRPGHRRGLCQSAVEVAPSSARAAARGAESARCHHPSGVVESAERSAGRRGRLGDHPSAARQREGDVLHVIAERLTDLSHFLGDRVVAAWNFH